MLPNPKPMGSLSSGLLARKGQARPAMRPQGFGGFGAVPQGLDDLGWNDMGGSAGEPEKPSVVAPIAAPAPAPAASEATPAASGPTPPVLLEREALKASIEAPKVERAVSVPTATRLRREAMQQGKAAFTLRVDSDRHLKLRLASALTNRSAQDLVTQALDALIAAIPEVDLMVAQLPKPVAARKAGRKQ